MLFRKQRKQAAALSSLMAQTRDTMVCLEFNDPIDITQPQPIIDSKLRDCVVVDASQSFARYLGFKDREEVIGTPAMRLFGGEVPQWFSNFGQEVEARNFENLERIVHVPVGDKTRTMRIQMQSIFEKKLLVRQWITIRDISAEEAGRIALEENERFKLLAIEAVGLRTFRLDFDPADETNPYGDMRVGETPFPDWWDRVYTADQPAMEKSFERFLKGETDQMHSIFRSQSDDNEERWYETWSVASGRNVDNQPRGIFGVVMDRTETKKMESKLISAQRLESLGVLAGGIAHDFNNLLLSMVGAIDLVKRRHPDARGLLGPVDEAAGQLTALCEQLLTYAGRGIGDLNELNVSSTIAGFRELLELSVDKNARIDISIEENCWVQGDASQLRQVVMNLVRNASDALQSREGSIHVEVVRQRYQPDWPVSFHLAEGLKPGNYVAIRVSDTGAGIDAAEKEHLFDPFFTTKFTGRGLGLAVVLGVVKAHGGAIHIDSVVDAGTTITVVIPELIATPTVMQTELEAAHESIHGCVLVVDDDESVRNMAGLLLKELGMSVEFADNGLSAIELVDRQPEKYDVIMMDVTMPGMDGIAASGRILEKHPDAKIVICSGYSNLTLPDRLINAVSFLKKPYRLSVLQDRMLAVMNSE